MKRSSPQGRRSQRVASKPVKTIKGFQWDHEDSQLRKLAARIESIHEEERKRVAQEVHDELGQALTGLKMDLAWLMTRIKGNPDVLRRARTMLGLIDRIVESARRIATDLRPGILDQLGLFAALEWQAQRFQAETGIPTGCSIPELGRPVAAGPAVLIFRIIQEVLAEIARYGKGTHVDLKVRESDHTLVVSVQYNARGGKPSSHAELGMLGMRERARLLGGKIEFRGSEGRFMSVFLSVPLSRLAE